MSILDIQLRNRKLGEIRMGEQVPTSGGKTRPAKLEHFRFTTGEHDLAQDLAELYGGEPRPWKGHDGKWEVYSQVSEINVMIPWHPLESITWYEHWTAGGLQRRCDGNTQHGTNKHMSGRNR